MELTSANVEAVLMDCLFLDGEDTSNPKIGTGIVRNFGFHGERLEAYREHVASMLGQLPEPFMQDKGGGWSFLNACNRADGVQWGEHHNMEQLFALGDALGLSAWTMREMASVMPGGMPYVVVRTQD